ncbi:MAG: hypothetical protein V2A58_12820 [Planctomycetota bacterium]
MGNEKLKIARKDRGILRRLAGKVAEFAALPVQAEKRDLWHRHNALAPSRPLIFCDPEGGWQEIIPKSVLECQGERARNWEFRLRQEIFWGESMGDDRVIEPYWDVGWEGERSDWGIKEVRDESSVEKGAYRIVPSLPSYGDMDKLHAPRITVDHEATERKLDEAGEVFGGLLEVRHRGGWWWSLGMTWDVIKLRGLEQFMLDMYDEPENLHRLMSILRDGTLEMLDFLERENLLSLNNDGTYVGSGGFGYTNELPQKDFDGERVRPMDMWGFCESQETVGVSPALFEEFVFWYQLPLMERFGINCYGCCEPLDKRWDVVKRFPRLRRVSCSAWVNTPDMAEKLGDKYIYSMKPNPSDLAAAKMDEERVRAGLREAFRQTRDCRVECIMKDCHTIGNNPQNVMRWSRIAREEAEAIS